MENFCKDLRDQAMKIINYEEKKEIILIIEEKESYEKQKIVIYAKKNFVLIKITMENLNHIIKSEIIPIIQEDIEGQLIIFVI